MNYHNITKEDMLNGTGLRTVLWVSGCNHNCPGCQNPETHPEDSGIPFDKDALDELLNSLSPNYIEGLTFSGGDPLYPNNRSTVTDIAKKVKELYPNKNIWLYTGYLFEDIKDLEIISYIDVIVDGEFLIKLKDNNLHWKGSSNQRVIDVKESLIQKDIVIKT